MCRTNDCLRRPCQYLSYRLCMRKPKLHKLYVGGCYESDSLGLSARYRVIQVINIQFREHGWIQCWMKCIRYSVVSAFWNMRQPSTIKLTNYDFQNIALFNIIEDISMTCTWHRLMSPYFWLCDVAYTICEILLIGMERKTIEIISWPLLPYWQCNSQEEYT